MTQYKFATELKKGDVLISGGTIESITSPKDPRAALEVIVELKDGRTFYATKNEKFGILKEDDLD